LEYRIEYRERPVGVKVIGRGSVVQDQVQSNRSNDIRRDECCEKWEWLGTMPSPEHEQQHKMT
jgi:hypothetical protein